MATTIIASPRLIDKTLAERVLLKEGNLQDHPSPRPVNGRTYRIPENYCAYKPAYVNGKYRFGCYLIMEDVETNELVFLNPIVLVKQIHTVQDGCSKIISSSSFINKTLMRCISEYQGNLSYGDAIDYLKRMVLDGHFTYSCESYIVANSTEYICSLNYIG